MSISKKIIGSFLIVSLSFLIIMFLTKPLKVHAYTGIGDVRFEWEREIYDGVNLKHTMSYNQNKDQKTYTVDFNPKTAALKPIVTTGPGTVLYGNTMSKLIDHYEAKGDHVVFAFNGDGYDTSNGIPLGIGINDGKLLNSANSGRLGWGITASGEVKFGSTNLPMSFKIDNGSPITLTHVNKERKTDTSGVYFLTEDFYPTTESTQAGVEVVLTVDPGQDGLRIGQPYNVTVQQVFTVGNNSSKNKTAIGAGKAVLAAHTNSPHYNTLKNLRAGQKITVNVDDNTDSRINWSEIVAGMGIFHLLLDNGVETSALSNTDIHPRTVMGVRADGSVVMMQSDGRQVGWASGFSFRETVEYLRDEFNCVNVFNFDGGGSSTTAVTLPGDQKATVLNRPSDGRERSNANAFLLVATKAPITGKPVEKLHIYPSIQENNANKGMILENGKMSFNVRGTDRNYYPVPLTGTVSYRIENTVGNIGSITSNGIFTANSGSAKGKIIASYGSLEAEFDIEVVNSITSIERDVTIISVAPGATQNLEFRALKDGVPIIMSNESLTFQLNPASLGTVSSAGVFKAVDGQGTGSLKVSYKTFNLSIPVEVGRMPSMILDFEEDIFANGWIKRYTNMPNNGGSGEISINTDERYVKHGDASLRIDYDFQTKPLTGTVAIEIGEPGGTVLEGKPTAISSWVYGDGNGGWYRVQLTGGKYAGDTNIDWVGWRYIETEIPEDAVWPITVMYPVRLLGTGTIANNKKGTIYVDSVRAIYGFQNDDNIAPVIDNAVFPANGSVTGNRQQVISFKASDANTGINRARTQMFINGQLVDNLQQTVNQDGSVDIMFNPSALSALSLGKQDVKVRVEDNFGNKTFKEWSFTVTSSALEVSATTPEDTVISADQSFVYNIKATNTDSFTKMDLKINYNKDSVEYVSLLSAPGVSVTYENNNTTTGVLSLTLIGMEDVGPIIEDLIKISFKAKKLVSGNTGIFVSEAKVTASGSEYDITLPSYDFPLLNYYKIDVSGVIFGSSSKITVKEDGVPVSGASIVIKQGSSEIDVPGVTDNSGKITTDLLTAYPIGTELQVYATKNGYFSDTLTVTILGTSGLVTMTDGASIRMKTQESDQGLRFVAKLATGVNATEHGFYLVYGKTTISALSSAINNQQGELTLNGKKVYQVVVPGLSKDNEFSVVLTGIPEAGYLDNLSAIAYVVENGIKQFVEVPVARSITEVALKMAKVNLGGQDILDILLATNINARPFGKNAFGQYEVYQGLYETNNFYLRNAFIADWNKKFNEDFTDLDPVAFFASAKTGLTDGISDNKNIAASNLYKFFNDTTYKNKWGWFLEYLLDEDGTTHVTRQIEALKGNGTHTEGYGLFHTNHLSYSIANFFNQSHDLGGYTAINFTMASRYDNVKNFNDKIFIDPSKYVIAKVGDQVTIGEDIPLLGGYVFENYMADSTLVMPGGTYTIGQPLKFVSKFRTVDYTVKYYDGETELTSLGTTYNVENKVDLPIPTKDNHVFLGWYTSPTFTGSAVTSISIGSTGNKTFYAKFEETQSGNYTITYELNGGSHFLGFSDRDEMMIAFLTDFHTYLNSSMNLNEFIHGVGQTSGFNGSYDEEIAKLRARNDKTVNPSGGFVNQPEYHRWLAIIDMMDEYTGLVNANQTGEFWSSDYTAKPRFKQFIRKTAQGGVGADHEIFERIPAEYQSVDLILQFTASSPKIILPTAIKKGFVFDGWYLTSDFSGSKVTEIPTGSTGNKTLYAKWK